MGVIDLRRAVGAADLCELLAAAFAFPTADLAAALVNGAFRSDARACLVDAGADEEAVQAAAAPLAFTDGADELLALMRKGYSLLYLAPGSHVPVFPYESAFRHRAEHAPGSPALFRSPVTQDVERQMRAFGVVPPDARTEPPDSLWNECAFLAFVLGSVAEAVQGDDDQRAALCTRAAVQFWGDHGARWLAAFTEATVRAADQLDETTWTDPYRRLAVFGKAACEAVGGFVASLEA